jgi:Xaa-Pro aminopeptidase
MMFSAATYTERRAQLTRQVHHGKLLFLGNEEVGMNYKGNTYHFRQDSHFLYFFGIDRAGLAAVIDTDSGETTIYGDELTMDDIVWTGPLPSIAEQAAQTGVHKVAPASELADALAGTAGVHYLPPYRHHNLVRLHELLGVPIAEIKANASQEFIQGIIRLRQYKRPEEIAEMDKAASLSAQLHITAMLSARPGMTEAQVHAAVEAAALSQQVSLSFPAIVTVDGQVLHNHSHHNAMRAGQLLLVDAGAESRMHYAGDLTRTLPVGATFTQRQREIYQAVLDGQLAAIHSLRPGLPYKEAHMQAARSITNSLKAIGLMRGDTEEAVQAGAHALFWPHGLGHMLGLDVHDMEDLGENNVGYGPDFERSTQFGTAFLRLAKTLEPGFAVTVEPGIYFIPALIDQWSSQGLHKSFINYQAVEGYKDFGGIRIEDDYLITDDGARILGGHLAKTIAEVEALRAGVEG